MPEELRLIKDQDTEYIQKFFCEALPDYEITIQVEPAYDTDHWGVLILTNIPNEDVNKNGTVIKSLISKIEEELNAEAYWEWEALCKCGNQSRAYTYDDANDDYDPCVCGECSTKEFCETHVNKCQNCGKEYKPWNGDGSWKTRLEVYVTSEKDLPSIEYEDSEDSMKKHALAEEKQTRENAEIYEIGHNIHVTPMIEWEFCCRDCAKADYKKWLMRVLEHPFTKECLK